MITENKTTDAIVRNLDNMLTDIDTSTSSIFVADVVVV